MLVSQWPAYLYPSKMPLGTIYEGMLLELVFKWLSDCKNSVFTLHVCICHVLLFISGMSVCRQVCKEFTTSIFTTNILKFCRKFIVKNDEKKTSMVLELWYERAQRDF